MLPRQKRPPLGGESQEDNVRRVTQISETENSIQISIKSPATFQVNKKVYKKVNKKVNKKSVRYPKIL